MSEITMRKGGVVLVDDEDFDELNRAKWHLNSSGYACRCRTLDSGEKKNSLMHREILCVTDAKIQVDHINGDRLDNRKGNLRLCNRDQNNYNRGDISRNKLGLKGVVKMRCCNRYRAEIWFDKKRKHLGLFLTPEEAHAAYCEAAKELHGEFANFGRPSSRIEETRP